MPDLRVTDAEIDAAAAHLRDAAGPLADAVGFDPGIVGSEIVAAALGDADSLLRQLIGVLATVSDDVAASIGAIGASLTEADVRLAGAG